MKRTIWVLLMIFSLLLTGIALGEETAAAADEKPAPVVPGDYLRRYPDSEAAGEDGSVTEIYNDISLETYNAFVLYLRDENSTRDKATRARVIETGGNPVIHGDVSFLAVKGKPGYSYDFNLETGEWKIMYTDGIYSARSRTAKKQYEKMLSLIAEGKTAEAVQAYRGIPDATRYQPAADYIAAHAEMASAVSKYRFEVPGEYVTFGHYEQDGDPADGPEAIEWLVLDVQDGYSLLISRYALDAVPYNTEFGEVTWETSSIRAWLNGEFYDAAFDEKEKTAVLTAETDNSAEQGSSEYETEGSNNTQDAVLLLSCSEAWQYFTADDARKCTATAYAVKQGAWTSPDDAAACAWWLRSPGSNASCAMRVSGDGTGRSAFVDYEDPAVRPVIRIDLNSDAF